LNNIKFYLASERADHGTLPVLQHDGAVSLENDQLRTVFSLIRVIRLPLHPEGIVVVVDFFSIRAPLETRLVHPQRIRPVTSVVLPVISLNLNLKAMD